MSPTNGETKTNPASNAPNQNLFSLDNVSLVYRALPALNTINWQFAPRQQWACLGPNGAGKTSLANILSQQARTFSGDYHRSETLRQGGVAYVCFEQAKSLCERDNKLDDSEFRADASDPGTTVGDLLRSTHADPEELQQWCERLGVQALLNRGLRFLSTGEMRKALLIQAILRKPALLILDSPLDGLDAATQQAMRAIIGELLQTDQSVLMLCRQMEDIPEGISHVLVLCNGEVFVQGERNTVLHNPEVQGLMRPPLPALGDLPTPAPRPYVLSDTLADKDPLIELRNVDVHYGEVQVLRAVNWRFDRGTHCCVSGPNGCGKTTLLSLITGDNHKAYGQDITLFGLRRGSGESIWDIKQKYGQIDTQLQLKFARRMRVIEVVVSGFFDTIGLYDAWGDAQRDHAQSWLDALGLGGLSQESFDALSFGLQRMVLLARAMVKSPLILLLDEPTLGLDGHHKALLLRAIDHIARHSDTQIIFVSHSPGDKPECINQQLTFVPSDNGFDVVSEFLPEALGS